MSAHAPAARHARIPVVARGRRGALPSRPSAIADDANEVLVSAASAWEIATKHRIGKLPAVAAIVADIDAVLNGQSFVGLPISIGHAQALAEDLTLVSNEQIFDTYGVKRLW